MKKISILLVLCMLAGVFIAGCGLTDSYGDRWHRYKHITDINSRELVDDFDFIMLYDHNSRLTRYHPRVGN